MTDDSWPTKESMDFHPTDPPRGMEYYNLDELSEEQRKKLNDLKINAARSNEKYLASHPEIRAIVVILLKYLFRYRPKIKVHEFIARFFNRSDESIEHDIQEYLETRKGHVSENLSAVNIALRRKQPKKDDLLDRLLEMICDEKCTCIPESQIKIDSYQRFDDFSFVETEHWLTPKSSTEKAASTVESIPSAVKKLMEYMESGEEEEDQSEDLADVNIFDFFLTPAPPQEQVKEKPKVEEVLTEEKMEMKEVTEEEEETETADAPKAKVVQIMEDPEKLREKLAKRIRSRSDEEKLIKAEKEETKIVEELKTEETKIEETMKLEETKIEEISKIEEIVENQESKIEDEKKQEETSPTSKEEV